MLEYFEKRQKTYPQDVKGKFRKIKNILNWVFLSIYLLVPFIRFDRGPNIANQAVLIDLPNSRAFFFFIEIWPEEVYYLVGILFLAAVLLFFVTSLFGRVWCGYSCFQTVWTDLFIKTERFFQGDRNKRILLDRKFFSWSNIWRKAATHLTWILTSLVTGFCFTLYFNDSWAALKNLTDFNLSTTIIGWTLGIATATYIMAGFAREQVCNYMCPYARFQSAMFDNDTLIISYDQKRGEPRGKFKQGSSWENRGHCIDCQQCVVVCPQNIDIRNGLQMECIACGLCIDACDGVMEKMNLPKGLIRYDTTSNMENKNPNHKTRFRILRPRTFYYLAIIAVACSIIFYNLISRADINLKVISDRNPIFVMLSNGDIRNGYTVKISNRSFIDKDYHLELKGITNLKLKLADIENVTIDSLKVIADSVGSFKIYASANQNDLDSENGRTKIDFIVTDNKTGEVINYPGVFISK